jgi:diadenosine tetraphosphate (Ap4A) HIT family hydrolase
MELSEVQDELIDNADFEEVGSLSKAKAFAEEQGITGYKLQFNVGKGGGQEVPYLHLHFLSEKELGK